MKVSTLISVASALLVAVIPVRQTLAGDAATDAGWRQVAYSCESGQPLKIAFRESGRAVQVTSADKPAVKLIARPAKVGFRYSDDRYELRGEGDAVTWQIGSKAPVKCRSEGPVADKFAAAHIP